ncbi:erythronate-4-phosphate dehydrogenase [Dysgonomonas sp. PH5-45]|uniref:4-phosphoerythronate dehydrogenase PdxB n=1 Tax=unclassified Dysgonomonas TaxID=2630389 RepID=UPI002473E950|nr:MULTISPECIES: 4-phosphoerythronate dehydrogenase PdxB [unclassified Dysgonomonas]MDH6355179.1 erythronate-4-phosphate dehydrogenase [Dysgonomonas sp. PH5-45]MDH6388095.1 erythronate-4-phosphate dehydrogenase [Dysgonomonas sp. PH5-37]
MKILADANIPFLKGAAEHYGDVTYLAGNEFTPQIIKDADTLIVRTLTRFGEENLKDSAVKLICTTSIGFDHIDTRYCEQNGIRWTNAPGCNSGSVQQYIVSALIHMAQTKGFDLKDKTIGIVGVGNVGKKVAQACRILGMRVLLNDPPRQKAEGSAQFVDMDTIVGEADIITFHTPLTKEGEYKTLHLANESFFANLRRNPIIINAARGGVVKTDAIKEVIRMGKVSGTVIDCWENEPDIDIEYMQLADVATSHIAGYSADGKANATRMALQAVADFYGLSKQPIEAIKAPEAPNPVIDMTLFTGNRLYEAILYPYHLLTDNDKLRTEPQKFNYLRSYYPLRREYCAYSVMNANAGEAAVLKELGFNVI